MRKLYAAATSKAFAVFAIVLSVLFVQDLNAQSAANYAYSTATNGSLALDKDGNAIDMSAGTTQLYGASVDTYTGVVQNLGFDFFFMGARYAQFSANPDGQVRLGSTAISGHTSSATASVPLILVNNTDGATSASGKVVYKVQNGTGGKVLIIEWNNVMLVWNGTATPTSTFQLRLYENSGVIEMVYGSMSNNSSSALNNSIGFSSSNTANTIGQLTTINTTPTYSTSATSYTTTSFAASTAFANLNSSSDGSRRVFRFTPNAPSAAPTGLNFTAVTAGSITLNWTDNASNEQGYAIYRSTDNVNFTYVASAAANAVSSVQSGLMAGTTYYWKVFAFSEGAVSSAVSASQATNAGTIGGVKTVGPGGDYATLTAAFAAINTNGLSGNVSLELQAGYLSSNEPAFPIPTSGAIVGNSTVTIYPAVAGLSITSGSTTGTLNFNGGKNIIIDGRVGATGSTPNLVVENTNAGTSYAIQFINDANGNTVKYCNIRSRNTSTSSGTIVFAGGITTGNDNNTIDNNNITDGTSQPLNGIYSSGTSTAIDNSNNTISNNNISNFFSAGSATHGIYLTSGNAAWTISGNSFYQTSNRTYTTANTHYGIRVDNTNGNGFVISNNFIGGSSSSAGGAAYTIAGTVANLFRAIYVNVGSTSATSVQGNEIKNISFTTSSGTTTLPGMFSGIHVGAGLVNVGTTNGNTIGATSGNGSIIVTSTTSGGLFTGIYATSSAVVSIQNNNIGSISTGGAAAIGYSFNGISIAGSGNHIVSQNTIGSAAANSIAIGTSGTTTAAVTLIGIANSGSGTITISSNTINNLSAFSSSSSTVFRGITSSSGTVTITSNTISNISSNTTNTSVSSGGLAGLGIYFSGGTSPVISGNTIFNLSLTNTGTGGYNLAGISYTAPSSSITISKNRIYGLSNASTATSATAPATASGIFIRDGNAANTTFANNMISLGNGQSTNTAFIGIWAQYGSSSTTTLKTYYNTINIEGSATGAQPSFGLYRGDFSTTAVTVLVMDVKNNIFTNSRTGGTGKHYAIANNYGVTTSSATGWGANASNYNLLNGGINGTVGYWSGDRDFAAWKTASAGDGNSFSGVAVTYVNSASDLHLNMGAAPTVIESGGTPVSVTDDFDGTTRNANFPDLGADEGSYTLLDNTAPVITYSTLGVSCTGGSRTLTNVTIVDVSGVPTTGALMPRIYFKKGSGAWVSTAGTLSSGDGFNGTWTFTIDATLVGGITTGDVISYYVIAQDQNGTPNIAANPTGVAANDVNSVVVHPTTPNTYNNAANLAAVNTVGAGGTYATLTAAAFAYNNGCMNGAVVFNLTDATYGAGETFPIVFNANIQASATNTLTIKPAAGTNPVISGSSATALITFNGAKYITLDGSNNGSTSRNLTISNTNTAASTAAIFVSSQGTGAGSTNIAVKNTNVNAGGGANTTYGIYAGGTSISSSGTGADNDNLTIQNNSVANAYYGIYTAGTAAVAAGGLDGLTISGNSIGSNTAANYVVFDGIYLAGAISPTVSGNTIFNIKTAGTINNSGIEVGSNVVNGSISSNTITGVHSTNTGGYGAYGINFSSGTGTTGVTVVNNAISDILTANYSTTSTQWNGFGIRITGGTNLKLYYNSINMFGAVTAGASAGMSANLLITSSSVTGLDIRNNVFVNTQTFGVTGSFAYNVYLGSSAITFGTLNYNDYFGTSGTNTTYRVAYDGTTARVALADWKTFTTKDANSIAADPTFNNNTNLAPLPGSPLSAAATPIAGITTDLVGTTRSGTTPTIGAFETARDAAAPSISYTPLALTCSASNRTLSATITDLSGVATGTEAPRLYFRKGTGTWYSTQGTLGAGSATNGTWDFTIDNSLMSGVSAGDNISYYIVAQDISAPANVGSNPAGVIATDVNTISSHTSSPSTYLIGNSIGGSYTVGAGGNYTTIGAAITAYQSSCLAGAVTFNLTDATYGAGETFPLTINAHSDASAVNTLTIKPATGVNTVVSGTGAAIFKLNGAKYVTIDGSNNGTTTRNLSLTNTSTGDGTSSIWIQSTGAAAGASNVTVKNANLSNGNNSNSNTFGVFFGGDDNDNVTIQNNTVSKANYGIYVFGTGGTSTGGNDNLVISGNTIGSSDAASYVITNGIYVTGSIAPIVSGNRIFNLKTNGAINVSGIDIAANVINGSVTGNTIHGIYSTSTSGYGAYGINFSSTTATTGVTVSNNVIYDIQTANYSSSSTTWNAFGIRITGGTNLKVYHNSINLFGAVTSGTSSGMSANMVITSSTVTGLDVRNNVFSNTQTFGTSGSFVYNVYLDATVTFANLDNNSYYGTSGTNTTYRVGYGGFSGKATLADWKTYTTLDANSIGVNPQFNTNTVLMPAIGSPLIGAGTPLAAVTTDITGTARSATAPAIGAYETAGDGAPPVIAVNASPYACSTGDQTISANITDVTGVSTTGSLVPRIYYKKNAAGAWFSQPGTLASGTATNGNWNFTIVAADMGGLTTTDVINYYIVAQDVTSATNLGSFPAGVTAVDVNTVSVHPTTTLQMVLTGTNMSGNYNVGGGGAYPTLTAAVAAYNQGCLTGAVTFTLTDPGYNTSETFPIVINSNAYASTTNTLTIKPAANTAVLIQGSSGATAAGLIKLNGADYVTIDGINDASGTKLTLDNTSTTTGSAVIWLSSNGAGQGATNNTIKNVILKGGIDQKAGSGTSYGIVIAGNALGTIGNVSGGDDNDNNTIDTCTFSKLRYGIYTRGGSTTNPNTGTIIKRNVIGAGAFGVDEIGKAGIVVREEDGVEIINNEIRYVGGDMDNNPGASTRAGIALATDATWTPTSVYVKNAKVMNNVIHDIMDEETGAAVGVILAGADGTNATNNIVANNFIYSIKANGTSGSNQAVGIGISAGNSDKVVFNSINMTGSVIPTATATVPTVSNFGIRVSSTNASNLSILNNIVVMDLIGGGALANYCIDLPTGYSFGTGNMNYNNWFANPANSQSRTGSTNNGAANQSANLAAWQAVTSRDANSKEVDPLFVSATDLHLTLASTMDGQGTPVAGITTDIDNQTRSITTPDMGADELPAAVGFDIKPLALISPAVAAKGCYGDAETITVSIQNNGSSTINFAGTPVTVQVNVTGATTFSFPAKVINSGTLAAGASMNVTVSTVGVDELDMSTPGVYQFDISTSVTGTTDVNTSNDVLQETRTKEMLTVGVTTASPDGYCSTGGKPFLSATGANGYTSLQWEESTSSGAGFAPIPGATTPTFTVGSNISQTMFYKLIATCGANTDESGEMSVLLNNPQPLTTIPATRCGLGTVTLQATADAGNVLKWYTAATGGTAIATGTSLVTPPINTTTTYYVASSMPNANTFNMGYTSETTVNLAANATQGMYFNTTSAARINSVKIYPSEAGTLNVTLKDGTGATVATQAFTLTAGDVSNTVQKTLTLTNFNIPANSTAWSLNYDIAINRGIGTYTYPVNKNGLSITGNTVDGNNITNGTRWYFWDWNVTTDCEGTRVPVIATVTAAPALTAITATPNMICAGQSSTLEVTSANTNYTYSWSPSAQTGNSISVSPAGTTTYTVTATDAGTGCVNAGTVSVSVNPVPAAIVFTPATVTMCPGSPAQALNFTGGSLTNIPVFTEDFNGAATGWTKTNTGTGGTVANADWTLQPDGFAVGTTIFHSNDNSQFIFSSSDAQGIGSTTNTTLTSPVINLSGYTSASLSFYHHYDDWDTDDQIVVEVSTNGTSWTVLKTYITDQGTAGGFATDNISLNSVAGQGTVYLRFRYFATWGYYWAIDNVTVKGTAATTMTWSPAADLYTDAAGTAAYVSNAHATTVYANPASTSTYTATVSSAAGCTTSNTVTVTRSSAVTNATALAGTAGGAQVCSGNQDVVAINNFFNNCNIIATVAPSGGAAVSGNVNACVKIDNAVPSAPNGQKYVQRYFEITPAANKTTATSTITLYFTQAEFNAYNSAVGAGGAALPSNSGDATGIANLKVTQFNHGGVGTGFATYPAGSGLMIDPVDASITYDAAANGGAGMWSVTFNATGSGAFFVHTGNFVLPVTITNFKGENAGSVNKLFWNTSTEINNKGFELERSADGVNYKMITFVASKANGGNSTSALGYNFDDVKPMVGANYYRLKQIDNDGKYAYSNVVVLNRKVSEITFTKVYPNPATTELNVMITSPRAEKLTLVVTDLTGKVVMQTATNVVTGDNLQQLRVDKLAGGTYMIKAICANGCETAVHKFVKQ
jgi:hypothetical protein